MILADLHPSENISAALAARLARRRDPEEEEHTRPAARSSEAGEPKLMIKGCFYIGWRGVVKQRRMRVDEKLPCQ